MKTLIDEYFDFGFKVLPVHVFYGKEKILIFGPKDSEFSKWGNAEINLENFRSRWKALESDNENLKKRFCWCINKGIQICIITGKRSGISVIDIDSKDGKEKILSLYKNLDDVPHDRSPRGGSHYYFRYSPQTKTVSNVLSGVDVRSDGGLIIVPPSIGYEWLKKIESIDKLVEFPPVLIGKFFCFDNKPHKKNEQIYEKKISLSEINDMLALIHHNGYCSYDNWLKICSAIWTEYSLDDTIKMLMKWHPYPDRKPYIYEYKYNHRMENLTIGTLIHFYQEAKKEFSPVPLSSRPVDPIIKVEQKNVEKSNEFSPEELSPEEFSREIEKNINLLQLVR